MTKTAWVTKPELKRAAEVARDLGVVIKISGGGAGRPSDTFLTRRGYLKLTKSLTEDRAWDVQAKIIDCYFAFWALTSDKIAGQVHAIDDGDEEDEIGYQVRVDRLLLRLRSTHE